MDARLNIDIQPASEQAYSALPDSSPQSTSDFLFELAYPLIARPIKRLITAFFERDDGDYHWQQPIVDALMWIGYPIMILHEDAFLIRACYERLKEVGQLALDIGNEDLYPRTRIKHALASVIAITTAVYFSLQFAALPYFFKDHEITDELALNPTQLFDEFMALSLFMKIAGSLLSYLGLTMGYLLGKELVLRDIPNTLHRLTLNVSVDYLFREANQQSSAWILIDVPGRLLEEIATIPAWLMKLALHHTKQLTNVKPWLNDNGIIEIEPDNYRMNQNKLTNHHLDTTWRASLSKHLGFGTPTKRPTTSDLKYTFLDLNTTPAQYNELLEEKKSEYNLVTTRCFHYLKPNHQQAALEDDLITHYLSDRVNLKLGIAPAKPLLPRTAPPPLSNGWNIAAIREPEIKKLIELQLPQNKRELIDQAKKYQTSLYLFYSKAKPCATPSSYPSRRTSSQVPSINLADNDGLLIIDGEKTSEADDHKDVSKENRKTPSPK